MNRSTLIRAAIITGLALGGLTACAGGEPSSSARVAVTSAQRAVAPVTTTTAPPAASAQPAQPGASRPPASSAPPSTTSTPPSSSSSTSDTGAEKLNVVTNTKLGSIVTDANGMTLYRLDTDQVNPPKSTCVGDCAKVFSPVPMPADGTVGVAGIYAKLLGQLVRQDGIVQQTLAGRPLYRFVADTAPGDTLGHGLSGAAAITPTGAKAVARAS